MPQPPPRLYAVSYLRLRHWETGKAGGRHDPQARRPAMPNVVAPSGVTGEEQTMKTTTQTQVKSQTSLMTLVTIAVMGLGLITVAGHVQATTLHDAAHDVRHATGFPCH